MIFQMQECITLIKSDSKHIYNIKRLLFQINAFELTNIKECIKNHY